MAEINYPELGDGSAPRRWYNEGDIFDHPSGVTYRAERSGVILPNGKPKLQWVPVPEPSK